MITLSLEKARELLKEAVAERGENYRYHDDYNVCEYADHNGKPACIIGMLFDKLGLLNKVAETENGTGILGLMHDNLKYDLNMSYQTLYALSAAQQEQDGNRTWGQALEAFERVAKENVDIAHQMVGDNFFVDITIVDISIDDIIEDSNA